MAVDVRVQVADFDAGLELARLRVGKPSVGAVVSFTGIVRDANVVGDVSAEVGSLTLEHYPGMTERSLEAICATACTRWALTDVVVIHRIGTLLPTDQIVFVATSAAHRGAAFDACSYVMDYLKTEAPFWKKEVTPDGDRWVEARSTDAEAAGRWDDAPKRSAT